MHAGTYLLKLQSDDVVLGGMPGRAYLLKRGTTWNYLKPAETTQKLPETIWNHLKPKFAQILHPKVFLGKFGLKNISFPNWLKFGIGVHCYILILNLMFIFPKILSLTFFWGKFGSKIWSSPNSLKLGTGVHCYVFITILMVIFSNFCHLCFFGQILSQNLKLVK